VHQLLACEGVEVAYTPLYRFAVKHCCFHDHRPTVRVADCEPGEVAEVDFGRLGLIPDTERPDHQRRGAHALIVTLGHSRHQRA